MQQKINVPSNKRKFAAMVYDWILCIACLLVFTGIVVTLNRGGTITLNQKPFFNLGLIGIIITYFIGFWRQGGQTPGMKVWKIYLVANKQPAETNKLLIRFVVMLLTLGLAIFPAFFRKDKKGLHDMLSKTSLRLK